MGSQSKGEACKRKIEKLDFYLEFSSLIILVRTQYFLAKAVSK